MRETRALKTCFTIDRGTTERDSSLRPTVLSGRVLKTHTSFPLGICPPRQSTDYRTHSILSTNLTMDNRISLSKQHLPTVPPATPSAPQTLAQVAVPQIPLKYWQTPPTAMNWGRDRLPIGHFAADCATTSRCACRCAHYSGPHRIGLHPLSCAP